ncbi:MAG: isocitrate/isopropylmalate dehydrogenase family protein [Candidatus Methanofastidiosia archaeon]
MTYKLAILPGDGTGREVMTQGLKVLDVISELEELSFEKKIFECGGEYYLKTGREWEEDAFVACKKVDAILLGAIGYPKARLPSGDLAGASVVFGLRFGLDLYANVRPTKLYPNVYHKISGKFKEVWQEKNVDFVIVRENTEGLYTPARGGLTRFGEMEVAIDTRVITKKGCRRVIEFAFRLCLKRNGAPSDEKRRVTCVDKSNVLRGCQLFRETYNEISKDYPEVEKDYAYIDAFTQWLIRNPEFFDVCVTPNMFGDIATDLASVLQGGMGMAASANIGDKHGMFEPVHGSSPKHAGRDEVNPMATISSVQMMLSWLSERKNDLKLQKASENVEKALIEVLREGKTLTYDLGGRAKCSEVGDAICEKLKDFY